MDDKIFDGKYTLEQLRQNFVMLNADEIEIPRKWLLELIVLAQQSEAEQKHLEGQIETQVKVIEKLNEENDNLRETILVLEQGL